MADGWNKSALERLVQAKAAKAGKTEKKKEKKLEKRKGYWSNPDGFYTTADYSSTLFDSSSLSWQDAVLWQSFKQPSPALFQYTAPAPNPFFNQEFPTEEEPKKEKIKLPKKWAVDLDK